MNKDQALAILDRWLSPAATRRLFDKLGRQVWTATEGPRKLRAALLGDQPRHTVLSAFATHAASLKHHSPAPNGPPPAERAAADAEDFHALIRAYHQRGYTVRVPDVLKLSPELRQVARAIEYLLHQPVSAALFWSYAGAGAAIHYDNRDNLVIQLEGRKRWFVSTDPPGLYNDWVQLGVAPPDLKNFQVIDVEPGDIIYLPRGTPHSVDSTTESLHVAILFNPATLRDMLIAAIDDLSDLDRSLRETAPSGLDASNLDELMAKLQQASRQLVERCRSEPFVRQAVEHRSAKVLADLPPLEIRDEQAELNENARVRHAPLAVGALRATSHYLGFSYPGGQIAIHPGVEPEMRFIADTPEFSISDIPGRSGIDVRKALVQRLISSGFLQLID